MVCKINLKNSDLMSYSELAELVSLSRTLTGCRNHLGATLADSGSKEGAVGADTAPAGR